MAEIWMVDSVVNCTAECTWTDKDRATAVFIECYLPTDDIYTALKLTRGALGEIGFEVVAFDRCMRFHLEHWNEQSEGHRKVRESVATARSTGKPVVGEIRWRS